MPKTKNTIESPAPAHDASEVAEGYAFSGRHFIASYAGCDMEALCDVKKLMAALKRAAKASGATILNAVEHVFPPNGFTAVLLLSESHASIHTYPEHGACFVDLFTCGDTCQAEAFDAVLCGYLRPKRHSKRMLLREEEIHDEDLRIRAA